MKVDLLIALFFLSMVTGLISLIHRWCWSNQQKTPWLVVFSRTYFPIFMTVFIIRSFIFQHFYVPTNSLAPTVKAGDYLFVSQFDYGLRLSSFQRKLIAFGEVKRGDILVFHWPVNPDVMMVKRVVGLPGDHMTYHHKQLTINQQKYPLKLVKKSDDVAIYQEGAPRPHQIQIQPNHQTEDFFDYIVPPGHYFVMGDNRDDSEDSRYWGVVEDRFIIGKAMRVIASWDTKTHWFRPQRYWKKI